MARFCIGPGTRLLIAWPQGAQRCESQPGLHMQGQLVRELGAVIRNQVPCLRASVLEAYGEILHRAWREAVGACALETEQLIQVHSS